MEIKFKKPPDKTGQEHNKQIYSHDSKRHNNISRTSILVWPVQESSQQALYYQCREKYLLNIVKIRCNTNRPTPTVVHQRATEPAVSSSGWLLTDFSSTEKEIPIWKGQLIWFPSHLTAKNTGHVWGYRVYQSLWDYCNLLLHSNCSRTTTTSP